MIKVCCKFEQNLTKAIKVKEDKPWMLMEFQIGHTENSGCVWMGVGIKMSKHIQSDVNIVTGESSYISSWKTLSSSTGHT